MLIPERNSDRQISERFSNRTFGITAAHQTIPITLTMISDTDAVDDKNLEYTGMFFGELQGTFDVHRRRDLLGRVLDSIWAISPCSAPAIC